MAEAKRKVLIITYYWPPSGGSGVQRWLKMSKYLPKYGWEPVIVTPENPGFDLHDPEQTKEVPSWMEVIRLPIWEPKVGGKKKKEGITKGQILNTQHEGFLYKLITWVRGNFFFPDGRMFWIRPTFRYLKRYVEEQNIQHVITTGPPHSMHLVGLRLKKQFPSLVWVADFRDPWSKWDLLQDFRPTQWAMNRHQKLERKVLQRANEVVTIGPTLQKEFEALGSRPVNVVTNGYDEADFDGLGSKAPVWEGKMLLSHVGTITEARNPETLMETLRNLRGDTGETLQKMQFEFVGNVNGRLQQEIQQAGLDKVVQCRAYIPHHEVSAYLQKAFVLLLFQNNTPESVGHLPAKVFEYLRTNRHIIVLGNPNSDMEQLLGDLEHVHFVNFGATAQLQQLLQELLTKFKAQELPNASEEKVQQYSRENGAKQISELLNKIQ